jgi:hypothetical protein
VPIEGVWVPGSDDKSACLRQAPSPCVRVSVPCVDSARAIRLDALLWLAEASVGERNLWTLCRALDFESIFGTGFSGWEEPLLAEMVAFCHFCGEDIPGDLEVGGQVHPAMLLHWRVQGTAVGLLRGLDRDRYRYLFSDRVVGDRPLAAYPVRGKANPEWASGGASREEGVGGGGSELRSDPDFLSGVPVEREPRWDSSPGRDTPPHPGNVLIIEDDDTSVGEDPFDDGKDVGRICGDPHGEGPDPLEPYGEGFAGTTGSWADTPFDPSPPRAQGEDDPYFPPQSPSVQGSWLGESPVPSPPQVQEEGDPYSLPRPSHAQGGWADASPIPSPPRAQEEDLYFPPPPPGYDNLGATGGMSPPPRLMKIWGPRVVGVPRPRPQQERGPGRVAIWGVRVAGG